MGLDTDTGMTDRLTIHEVAEQLPPISRLRSLCRALAALDIVRYPHPSLRGSRGRTFVREWRTGACAGFLRTGGGDGYLVAFTCYGALVLGFDHESPMSPYAAAPARTWPGVLEEVPAVFAPYVAEPPDFLTAEVPLVTACAWRTSDDDRWRAGTGIAFPDAAREPDGAGWLFALLTDPTPQAYLRDPRTDGAELPLEAVRHVYGLGGMTREVAAALNPDAPFETVAAELEQIGYPVAG